MSKQSVWTGLDRFGFSDKAKAAIMGNMGPESGFVSTNVEDRYTGSDLAYTAALDNGSYSRDSFATDNGKYYGYGLCQWTYPTRKLGLYDLAKSRGVSIGDEALQLDFMWQELHTAEFSGVLKVLQSDASLREMTEKFLVTFENPDDKSQSVKNYRVGIAEAIYAEFAGKADPKPTPEPPEEDKPDTPFWPPRQLCLGMVGSDVALLQSLLLCHDYNCGGISGIFDNRTKNMVLAFQTENELDVDAVAGKQTFRALGVNT